MTLGLHYLNDRNLSFAITLLCDLYIAFADRQHVALIMGQDLLQPGDFRQKAFDLIADEQFERS